MKWYLVVLSAVLAFQSLEAFPVMVTVNGSEQEVPLQIDNAAATRKKFSIYNPGHFKNKGEYALMMVAKTPDDQWNTADFYFTPKKDGEVTLSLQSGYKKGGDAWVLIRDVNLVELLPGKTEKSILKNGDFREKENLFPKNWTCCKTPYVIDSGKFRGLAISFSNSVSQKLKVRGNVGLKLTITAKTIF